MRSWLPESFSALPAETAKGNVMRVRINVHTASIHSDVAIDFEPDYPGDKGYLDSLGKMVKMKIADELISRSDLDQEVTAEQFKKMVESASRRVIPGGKVTSVYLENFVAL